jgi:hypothetical protein
MFLGITFVSACTVEVIPPPETKNGFKIFYVQKKIKIPVKVENNKTANTSNSTGDSSSSSPSHALTNNPSTNILINQSQKDIKIDTIYLPRNASLDLSDKDYRRVITSMSDANLEKIFKENKVKIVEKDGVLTIVDK